MNAETSQIDFDLVVRRARDAGMYVNRHKSWGPFDSGGDLYLMPRKRFRDEKVQTILKYATADQVHEELARIEARMIEANRATQINLKRNNNVVGEAKV
jgi:hypothetical protein